MAKLNVAKSTAKVLTHEGAVAQHVSPILELRRTILTCLLWENTFYEGADSVANRIANLVPHCSAIEVADLAREARDKMQLRHAPLYLVRQMARIKGNGPLVEETLEHIIQRADELSEFVALYWKDEKQPLSAGVKRGLARAFTKFNGHQIAKYNRDSKVKLRDVLFLCHAKPKDKEQAEVWKKLIDKTLEAPDTWEVSLSSGKDQKETFERLLREEKLGGLAVLRNLRNMQEAGVDRELIRTRLSAGIARALPFRFIAAARYAPQLEAEIESAMLKAAEGLNTIKGSIGLLVDVSGSMDDRFSPKSELTRLDAACGLAIHLREKVADLEVATFSNKLMVIPARRGFGLRDAIVQSQEHQSTKLRSALQALTVLWASKDRIIVVTDEQSHDGILRAWTPQAYVINVAPYKQGVSYGNGWTHVDGFSEQVLEYITAIEDTKDEA